MAVGVLKRVGFTIAWAALCVPALAQDTNQDDMGTLHEITFRSMLLTLTTLKTPRTPQSFPKPETRG